MTCAISSTPGLSKAKGARGFALEMFERVDVPLVIDADGLNAHAGRLEDLAGRDAPTILTPHGGELARVVRHSDAVTGGPGAIMVRRDIGPLQPDDALFEIFSHTRDLGEKDLTLALEVIEIPDQSRRRQQLPEQALTNGEWQLPQVVVLHGQQIEGKECHRVLHCGATYVEPASELGALLQPLKAGPAGLVQSNDLAIQHKTAYREA